MGQNCCAAGREKTDLAPKDDETIAPSGSQANEEPVKDEEISLGYKPEKEPEQETPEAPEVSQTVEVEADTEPVESENKSKDESDTEPVEVEKESKDEVKAPPKPSDTQSATLATLGHAAEETGSSDSDHEWEEERKLVIRNKSKFFNSKKQLVKFLRKDVEQIDNDGFSSIECSGNSYDPTSCEYIAELIRDKAGEDFFKADFSNMFVTRNKQMLPPAIKMLVDSVATKPIQELYMQDNAFGPIGVEQFKDFLSTAPHLTVLSVTNTGLGPEATSIIAQSLAANEHTKLKCLCISRSRVENPGALALAEYFASYDTLEYLEIFQNAIKDDAAAKLVESLLPSARSGALNNLEINDNNFKTEESLAALCTLIKEATNLGHMSIDSSDIEDEE